MHERRPYAEAGAAMRAAVARARDVRPRLKAADRAVLEAVLVLTASYSKLADRVYVAQVAELAGLNEKTARTSLLLLARAGVIVWEPRRGGTRSALSLPTSGGQWPGSLPGDSGPEVAGHSGPVVPGDSGPDTEKYSEEYPEKTPTRAHAREADPFAYLGGPR